jgi:hypothetical protein
MLVKSSKGTSRRHYKGIKLISCRAFNHANYEDMDINVAIPVFSIHGNHDDPSGVTFQHFKIVWPFIDESDRKDTSQRLTSYKFQA